MMAEDSLQSLNKQLREFAIARDWLQFQSPKNLSMAISGECGELIEHFQWLTEAQSLQLNADKKREVSYEMADILIYLLRMADRLDIDLIAAARDKMTINEKRFPVDKVHGRAGRAEDYG